MRAIAVILLVLFLLTVAAVLVTLNKPRRHGWNIGPNYHETFPAFLTDGQTHLVMGACYTGKCTDLGVIEPTPSMITHNRFDLSLNAGTALLFVPQDTHYEIRGNLFWCQIHGDTGAEPCECLKKLTPPGESAKEGQP